MGRAGDDVAFGLENRCVPTDAIWPPRRRRARRGRLPVRPGSADARALRRRAAAARAGRRRSRCGPGLLMLDEPTANLDPDGAAEVRSVARPGARATRRDAVLVEHRVEESLPLVDRVVVLEAGGGVVADGPPRDGLSRRTARGWPRPGSGCRTSPPAAPHAPRPPAARDARDRRATPTFRYPGRAADALGDVDLRVRSAEALAIVGPNGSGKSTLALLLAGLARAAHRDRWWPGRRSRRAAGTSRSRAGRRASSPRHIGTVFQDPEHQFLTGSVREELLLGPRRGPGSARPPRRRPTSCSSGCASAHSRRRTRSRSPAARSGGCRWRPRSRPRRALLVLDEPTFGQDRRTWAELVDLLAALRDAGAASASSTHDRAFAHALADRTLQLGTALMRS